MGLVAVTEGSTFGAVGGTDISRHCAAHRGSQSYLEPVVYLDSRGAMSVPMETGMGS